MTELIYDQLKTTAIGHARAYEYPEQPWDPEEVWKFRTEDSVQSLHPKEGLPPPFNEELGKGQFFDALRFFGAIMQSTTFDIQDIVVDTVQRKVTLRLKGIFDIKAVGDEPPVKGWSADYVWIMTMTQSGDKVCRVEEYMDSERLMKEVKPRAERYANLK